MWSVIPILHFEYSGIGENSLNTQNSMAFIICLAVIGKLGSMDTLNLDFERGFVTPTS